VTEHAGDPGRLSIEEIFWYFLKLGWLAFGGPVGQIGLMHLQVVERHKWLDEEEFVRALNFCHLLPGPEALQLAIYVGYKKGGYLAGALAGFLFIAPGFITLTALAWIYVRFGKTPQVLGVLWGFRPVGLALLLAALVRISCSSSSGAGSRSSVGASWSRSPPRSRSWSPPTPRPRSPPPGGCSTSRPFSSGSACSPSAARTRCFPTSAKEASPCTAGSPIAR
jgi:chromate transport protein ChrA